MTRRKCIVLACLATLAVYGATTVVVPPRSAGVVAPPPFVPIGNPNNPNGNGGSHGNKQTRPLAGATIDWGDPITSGLVGCWLCNENGGLTLYDLVKGKNSTLNGDTAVNYWGVGSLIGIGEAGRGVFIRNTANAYAEATSFTLGRTNVTVMVWYHHNALAAWVSGNAVLVMHEPVNTSWTLFFVGGVLYFQNNVVAISDNATRPADDVWHQVVGLNDGPTDKLYVDGLLVGSVNDAIGVTDSTSALEFGRSATIGFQYYGSIGPVYIWNRALSAREIGELYALPYRFIY